MLKQNSEPSNQLVWLVYGGSIEYRSEATFSILSAIYRTERNNFVMTVITDTPNHFSKLPINIVVIDEKIIKEWVGPDNYNHRCKPCALLSVLNGYEKNILIDTDTFFKKCPSLLFDLVNDKVILVDKILSWRVVCKTEAYESCNLYLSHKYHINDKHEYLNSGIIGLSKNYKGVLKDTIEIIDEVYKSSGEVFAIEEFSLSIAIKWKNISLIDQNDIVHHYWRRKFVYRSIIIKWLEKFKGRYLNEEAINEYYRLNISRPKPEPVFRLKCKIEALFLDKTLRRLYKELKYASYNYKDPYWSAIKEEMIGKSLLSFRQNHPYEFENLLNKVNLKKFPNNLQQTIDDAMTSLYNSYYGQID